MLTGRPPFTGDTPVAIAYKHVQEAVIPPRRVNANVPEALEAIVLRCLAKQPADRYPSAEDLRSDLRNFLEGQPVRAMGAAGAAAAGAMVGASVADVTMAVPTTPGGPVTPPGGTPAYVPPDEPGKRTGLYVALLIGGLALVAIVLFFVGTRLNQPTKQVAVPDVVGIEVTEAVNRVQAAGFKVETKNEISDRPAGTVFEQTPSGNTNADEGSTVLLRVSGGLGNAPVPGVVGRTQTAAESLLTNAGFVPNATMQADPDAPAGQVISQSPAPDVEAEKGSVVEIVVSSGPTQVTIPDLVGQSAAAASNTLGQLRLQVNTEQQPSTSVGVGEVISTSPSAGSVVPEGSTVTLVVSTGPPPTTTTTAPPTTTTTTTTRPTTTTTSSSSTTPVS